MCKRTPPATADLAPPNASLPAPVCLRAPASHGVMSTLSDSQISERSDAAPIQDSPRYRRLETIDRCDAETLNKFFQTKGKDEQTATWLANLAAKESLMTALPLAAVDFVSLYVSVFLTTGLVERMMGVSTKLVENQTAFFISLIILPVAHLAGLYPGIGYNSIVEFRQLARSLFVSLFVLAGIGWFCFPVHWAFYSISALVTFCVALPAGVTARFFARRFAKDHKWWGVSTFILAEPEYAAEIYRRLETMGEQGFRPAGVLLDPQMYWSEHEIVRNDKIPYFHISEAGEVARDLGVTSVIVSTNSDRETSASSLDRSPLAVIPNQVRLSSDDVDIGIWDHVYCVGTTTGLRMTGGQSNWFNLRLKRILDLTLSFAILLIGLPVWGLICLLTGLSSSGPIFYGQRRVGKGGREFTAWKVRTMVDNADEVLVDYLGSHPEARIEWEQTHKLEKDPRITLVGHFLRATSLDELPQLWNVIVGEMSLVGPRPIVDSPIYDQCYITDYPAEFEVYKSVRPGLSGLWQVRCRNRGVYEMRIYYDMYYIRNWSIWLDLYLILRTVKTVLFREGT